MHRGEDESFRKPHERIKYLIDNMRISDAQLAAALKPYGVCLTPELADPIRKYIHFLLLWNQKINLTAIRNPLEIVERHFGESLFALRAVPILQGRLADVGSGAGFPGMILKIGCPSLQVTLIEVNAKKVAFLSELRRQLGLSGVEIFRERFERIGGQLPRLDFITARAVGKFGDFLRWARDSLGPEGKVVLWLGADDAGRLQRTTDWVWQEPIQMPRSERRVLLVGLPRRA